MKLLLAGGAGYVGSVLGPKLLEQGHEVDVIDLFWFGNYLPDKIKVIKKNLIDCTEAELSKYDQIVFLAGLSNDPMAEFSPQKNFLYNSALPAYLAFIAKKAGVKRFIFSSSCSVYGDASDKLYDEHSPVHCKFPYGISKLQGEFGISLFSDENFSVISLRKGTISGHSPRMRMDLIINKMFMTAMTKNKIVINNPLIWRPICSINDAINAFLCAIQAKYSLNGIFNIASNNHTVGEVANITKEEISLLTGKNIALEIKNIQDKRNYRVTIDKAASLLGFHPKNNIKDIILNLYENRDYYGNYEKEDFYNFKIFQKLEKLDLM